MNLFIKLFLPWFLFLISCFPVSRISETWSEKTLKNLTLRQKIAQMMIYSMNMRFNEISGKKWKEIFDLIESDGIGGIHVWYGDATSSFILMNEMQKKSHIPILFDADLEYGLKQRFPSGTEFPPAMAISASGNSENAMKIGNIIGKEARSVGLHWNLSPVVDVNNNPLNPIINTRSFGESPEIVTEFSIQLMKGLQNGGMLSAAKHFPGHGDTETDSHSSLAVIPSDSSRLWQIELKPFKKIIENGVDAIMVAHIHAPDYQPDSERPASMSKFWINDILKSKLNFKGAVITDAMEMGGIVKNYSNAFALVEAIKAGSNIIIQNNNFKGSIDVVERAVLNGDIPISIINNSVLKMLKMKEKIGLDQNRYVNIANMHKILKNRNHKEFASLVASEAITCIKNDGNLIPLDINSKDTLYVIDLYDLKNNHFISKVSLRLKSNNIKIKTFQFDNSDSKKNMNFLISNIPKNSRILINAFSNPKASKNQIFLSEIQTELINKIVKKSKRVILASLGTPYLIQQFDNIPAYICAYKDSDLMQIALSNALMGKKEIKGILPISIPGIANIGDGLFLEKKNKINIPLTEYRPGKKIIQVRPEEVKIKTNSLKNLLDQSVKEKAWPGCVLLGAQNGKIFFQEAVGYHTYDEKREMRISDIFDIASITKVIATTSGIMKLYDNNKIKLNKPVVDYIPAFKGRIKKYQEIKSKVTVRDLLTHSSGLPKYRPYHIISGNIETKMDSIYNTGLIAEPGDTVMYSDIGLILLGKIIETISGVSLNDYVDSLIFSPLGMSTTFFNPPIEKIHRIVPTEIDENGTLIKGIVHDENARSFQGVSGHAGLFSTAKDLSIFSQMMLNKGIYGWTRIFKSETVELFTEKIMINENNFYALGWDSPKGKSLGGVFLSDVSFGHMGFTGTSLWIDPENQIIVILLSNAVHPGRKNKYPNYYNWSQKINSSVFESIGITKMNPNLKWRKIWEN